MSEGPALAATRDGRIVPETDPEAAFVLGSDLNEEKARQLGVSLEDVEAARAKAVAGPPENKGRGGKGAARGG